MASLSSTARLARISAHHPWRTVGAWVLLLVAAIAVQVIAPPRPWILEQVDLSSLPSSDRAGVADQLADEETHKPFNLQRGSLIRVSLLCLEPEEHVILFTVHHIVFDGWSIGILIQELSALCRAYGAGAPSSLEELPVQYSDFVRWQR